MTAEALVAHAEGRVLLRLQAMADQLSAVQRDLAELALKLANMQRDSVSFECLISDRVDQLEQQLRREADEASLAAYAAHYDGLTPVGVSAETPW